MTNQEAFDAAATHLLRQKKRSTNGDGVCMYRGPRGLKCAIGALIPDEIYNVMYEHSPIDLLLTDTEISDLFSGVDGQLLFDLQNIHDEFDSCEWRTNFYALAKMYGLSTAAIDAMTARPRKRKSGKPAANQENNDAA